MSAKHTEALKAIIAILNPPNDQPSKERLSRNQKLAEVERVAKEAVGVER